MSEKGAIKKSTAQAICDAVKVKEGTTEGVPFKDVAERILALPSASGENKLAQILEGTVTEIKADDLKDITKIRNHAFRYYRTLTSIEIPENVKEIGDYICSYCDKLERAVIRAEILGDYAFANCTNLTQFTLGASLKKTGYSLFRDGPSWNDVVTYYEGDVVSFCNIEFDDNSPITHWGGHLYFKNANGEYELLTNLVVPNTVPKINECAFKYSRDLITATIDCAAIYYDAFNNCRMLKSVILGDNVRELYSTIFSNCTALTDISVGNNVKTMAFNAFEDCTALMNFSIASPIKTSFSLRNSTELTIDSLKNIINALVDYSGTTNEGKYKLTLNSTCHATLEAEGATAPDGLTWSEYVTAKGWLLA